MTFTTKQLTGERVLVTGTDVLGTTGTTVLDSSEWNGVKAHLGYHEATDEFDAKVAEFFAPLTEAAEKLAAAGYTPQVDEDAIVVFDEGVEPTVGKQREVAHLGRDSIVLRLLERGDHDRLVWVNDSLEVLTKEELPATTGGGVNTTPDSEVTEGDTGGPRPPMAGLPLGD